MTLISIIIPCRNEERFIEGCLDSVLSFTLPPSVDIEVFIVDGLSEDRTVDLVRAVAARDDRVKLLSNPGRIQSSALNLALREATGEWVMRLDAHSFYPPDYLKLCLETAERTGADNVGGWFITHAGDDSYQASLVQAMTTHRFGVGNSGFRVGEGEGPADTVPYGFFRRDLFDRIGGFDERLLRAQDYEFNRRIIASGGRVWLNPEIRVLYHNQPRLVAFYRKQFEKEAPYNVYMWYIAPYAFTPRHGITGVFAAGVIAGAGVALRHRRLRVVYTGALACYAVLATVSAVQQAVRYRDPRHAFCLPWCFGGFHLSHGLGVLAGVARLATGTAPVRRTPDAR
jgi:glycosyltransferase involved in cell wall biosynthesis